jgi:hypothetical protein
LVLDVEPFADEAVVLDEGLAAHVLFGFGGSWDGVERHGEELCVRSGTFWGLAW